MSCLHSSVEVVAAERLFADVKELVARLDALEHHLVAHLHQVALRLHLEARHDAELRLLAVVLT